MHKAITIIQFKLEAATILRRKEFEMENRLLLDKIDPEKGVITIDGVSYTLIDSKFPTVNPAHPFQLTEEEETIIMKGMMERVIQMVSPERIFRRLPV